MIYIDTSVILAHLLAEDVRPPASLWAQTLVSSQLLEYETWVRINARGLAETHGDAVRQAIGRVALASMATPVLHRAMSPFPVAVRTLDALHLATIDFLRRQGQSVQLATYDDRQREAASAMGISLYRGVG